ncbi:hypothetical protein V2J09_023337 [Rumex salicifolius]
MAASVSHYFTSTAVSHLLLTRNSATRVTIKSLAVKRTSGYKMKVPYELKGGQIRQFHELPSGLKLEVIVQKKSGETAEGMERENSPLVFVHGSFHAAWCWAEHWLPFFARSGFDCYALSLLAQGESDDPSDKVAGTLETHAGDIAHFIQQELTMPPVLVGHSFGGLIVQNYIAKIGSEEILKRGSSFAELAGAILVCSVPPSGNSETFFCFQNIKAMRVWISFEVSILQAYCSFQGTVFQFFLPKFHLHSSLLTFGQVTRSLAAKAFQTDLPLCKETFFSPQMDDSLVLRYQELMKESSRKPLFDLRKLNASLPVPSIPKSSIKVLVLGAKEDFIVDSEGLAETGRFYEVSPVCIGGVAHDIMLDCHWEKGADVVLSWLYDFR